MKKTIIALSGTANVGKSMTLSRLGRQLQTAGGVTPDNIVGVEYRAVFAYLRINVGIQTFGDTDNVIRQGLLHFQTNSCDIIAIACKRFGATTNRLTTFASANGYRLIWAAPYEVRDGSITNDAIKSYGASHLLNMINDVISGSL